MDLVPIIAIVGPIVSAVAVAFITQRMAAKASPYSALAERVVRLESRVTELEEERSKLVAERDELLRTIKADRSFFRSYLRDVIAALRADRPIPPGPSWLQ